MCGTYRILSGVLLFIFLGYVHSSHLNTDQDIKAVANQLQELKDMHLVDLGRVIRDVDELKKALNHPLSIKDVQDKLEWATSAINYLRKELKDISAMLGNNALVHQLHEVTVQYQEVHDENERLLAAADKRDERIKELTIEVEKLKDQDIRTLTMVTEIRTLVEKLTEQIKDKEFEELHESENELMENHPHRHDSHRLKSDRARFLRHYKMIHAQVSQLVHGQGSLQTQILDIQRRLDKYEVPKCDMLSAKVETLEHETSLIRHQIENTTQKISDFDRVHASMLELREEVEGIENKADNTYPEFRKEISKLDINIAQLNAQASYLKEDQESLRQSVKAIAVSISNNIDHSDNDRKLLKKMNESIWELQNRTKQHFSRLNDHILKSESNHESNLTEIISLPELMGEVKELQPVQREYEDLVNQLPKDCSAVDGPPGTYLLHPGITPIDAWCSNGSTLLQRRINGSVEFNRKFHDYVKGFGDPTGEFWLGLENMYRITADNCSSMQIDMTDIYGGNWYASYEHFAVGSGDGGYTLDVSGFRGNASDAFEYQNHMEFSAKDRDRDISNSDCADNYEGGWWFSHCQHVNINGRYSLGLTWFDSSRNEWIAVATSEMRIFRRPGCT